jgi:hypothetical protein
MDARCTRISTSLMPISGVGTSSSHSPGAGLLFTRAFILLGMVSLTRTFPKHSLNLALYQVATMIPIAVALSAFSGKAN